MLDLPLDPGYTLRKLAEDREREREGPLEGFASLLKITSSQLSKLIENKASRPVVLDSWFSPLAILQHALPNSPLKIRLPLRSQSDLLGHLAVLTYRRYNSNTLRGR